MDSKNIGNKQFWLNNPCVLFSSFNLIPGPDLPLNERLNALTRIILIATVVMLVFEYEYWYWFLIAGLLIVMVLKIVGSKKTEGFSIPPTYIDGAEPMTTVPPLFSSEWSSPPAIYDEYTNVPPPQACGDYTEDRPIFGQYISSSRLFPYQSEHIQNVPLNDAQLLQNDEFTRDTLQFRNDIVRNYVNRMNRVYKNSCYDSISPYNSY